MRCLTGRVSATDNVRWEPARAAKDAPVAAHCVIVPAEQAAKSLSLALKLRPALPPTYPASTCQRERWLSRRLAAAPRNAEQVGRRHREAQILQQIKPASHLPTGAAAWLGSAMAKVCDSPARSRQGVDVRGPTLSLPGIPPRRQLGQCSPGGAKDQPSEPVRSDATREAATAAGQGRCF